MGAFLALHLIADQAKMLMVYPLSYGTPFAIVKILTLRLQIHDKWQE